MLEVRRPIVLPFLLIVLAVGPTAAQGVGDAVRHFDEGNLRYRQGDHRGALESYDRAVDTGFVSGAVFFNMGNAYYRLDETGQAIRYYEKAFELMPESSELRHNLALARALTTDQFSRLPRPFWVSWWRGIVQAFGAVPLFGAGVVFYFIAAGMLTLRIRGARGPWIRRGFTTAAVLAVVLVMAGLTASIEEHTTRRAVVLTSRVTLLEAPDGARSDLNIHEGLVLDVVSEDAGWVEVRLPNGAAGWMRAEALGVI